MPACLLSLTQHCQKQRGEMGLYRLGGGPWPSTWQVNMHSVALQNACEISLIQSSCSWIILESAWRTLSSKYLSEQWIWFWAWACNNFRVYLLFELGSGAPVSGIICIFNSPIDKAES